MNYALNPQTMRGLDLDFTISPRTNPAVSSQALPLGTQGNPVVVGSLDSRAQPTGVMSPKVSRGGMVGQVLLPALAGALAGPAGAAAGAIFGIASAAGKYRLSKDPLAQLQYTAAMEQAKLDAILARQAQQNPGMAFNSQAPALVREMQHVSQVTGIPENDPRFPETLARFRSAAVAVPTVRTRFTDSQGREVVVYTDGSTQIAGETMQSPAGMERQVGFAGQRAAAEGAGRAQGEINVTTAPANVERVAEAGAEVQARKLTAEEQAKANEGQYVATTTALTDFRKTRALLQRIRDAVERGPETGPVEQYRAIVDPDLQELRSYIEQNTLASYAAARAQGVTFGSTTESEWKKIASLGAQLGNTREANLRILSAALDQIDEQIGEAAGKVRRIPEGRGRMPAPEAPAKRPPLSSFERQY